MFNETNIVIENKTLKHIKKEIENEEDMVFINYFLIPVLIGVSFFLITYPWLGELFFNYYYMLEFTIYYSFILTTVTFILLLYL